MFLTYKYRVKNLSGELNRMAHAVNFVWNFCNDTQKHALKWRKRWPTGFDLSKLTSGSSKELGLYASSIGAVCTKYASCRGKRPYLRYRGKRSLGWVPLRAINITPDGDGFWSCGHLFKVFNSRKIPEGAVICDGSAFSQDSRRNWYLNVVIELPDVERREIKSAIGIDLGLKTFATFSNGESVKNPRNYLRLQKNLATASRARKYRQLRGIHAKISNRRKDFIHKLTLNIVRRFDFIAVGDVSAVRIAKTKLAKSVYDVSWSFFRNAVRYKAITHGATFKEVNEKLSSQVCSSCGALPQSRPKGSADLGIREWTCSECQVVHDRDVNAAKNILRLGYQAPVEGAVDKRTCQSSSCSAMPLPLYEALAC